MSVILFDLPNVKTGLLPFTYTRPVAEVRVGILKISEKWEYYLHQKVSFLTDSYLQEKYPFEEAPESLIINGAILPNDHLVSQILGLRERASLFQGNTFIAAKVKAEDVTHCINENWGKFPKQEFNGKFTFIEKPWHIFQHNAAEILHDFSLVTKGKVSQEIMDPHTITYGKENIFIEEGAKIKAAILNAENGPIYIGKDAQIHEGAMIKGPFALCEGSHVNMGAKIKGDSTIGPYSKVGGEISNSVIFGYTNKGHDGYLGNSVIGEWCNLGADTNSSNLKNNYANVKVWDYATEKFSDTGLQFCGLMMGDHSKSGINTMFNTGTAVGGMRQCIWHRVPKKSCPFICMGWRQWFFHLPIEKSFRSS